MSTSSDILSDVVPAKAAAEQRPSSWIAPIWSRLRGPVLAILFPLTMLVIWHLLTYGRKYSLIPPPSDVALSLYDLAFGGINDDAYSQSLMTHLLASISRVIRHAPTLEKMRGARSRDALAAVLMGADERDAA